MKRGTKIHDDRCHNREAGQISVPEKKTECTQKKERTHAEKTEREHKSQVDMSEDKESQSRRKARTGAQREHAKGPGHRAFLSPRRPALCPVGMASIAQGCQQS